MSSSKLSINELKSDCQKAGSNWSRISLIWNFYDSSKSCSSPVNFSFIVPKRLKSDGANIWWVDWMCNCSELGIQYNQNGVFSSIYLSASIWIYILISSRISMKYYSLSFIFNGNLFTMIRSDPLKKIVNMVFCSILVFLIFSIRQSLVRILWDD